jgi:NAD(P)-dependent dehydrogenase (short-subunit alcohol dehydrogenase family)
MQMDSLKMASFLQGSTALITGAAGGIGRACVEAFVAAGACVVASDWDETGAQLQEDFGKENCRFVRADITDEAAVKNLVAQTNECFGGLDVLINNAAVFVGSTVHETSLEEFEQLIAVNLRGAFLCCKYSYPHLEQSKGCIVNVSSMAGVQGEKGHAIYSATKGALNALTKAMAVDYGPDGIRCNALCPSSVITPNTDKLIDALPNPDSMISLRKSINHLGYTATPQEIAAVAVFLASPAAAFMTGAIVPVSGGSECGYGVKY